MRKSRPEISVVNASRFFVSHTNGSKTLTHVQTGSPCLTDGPYQRPGQTSTPDPERLMRIREGGRGGEAPQIVGDSFLFGHLAGKYDGHQAPQFGNYSRE